MATTGTSALSNEVKAAYDSDFMLQGQSMVYFDQLCDLRFVANGQRGNTYNFPIIESLQPNASVLDELTDVSAQQMRANEIVVTLQEYGGAIEVTKFVVATSYADVYKQAAFVNGYNLAESFDFVVRAVAGQGSRVVFPSGVTARSSLSGATAGHRLSASALEQLAVIGRRQKMPLFEDNSLCAVVHPHQHYDLLQDSDVRTMASRQHPEILFNGEEGYWGGIRLIVSAGAKVFYGMGTTQTSASSTTLSSAVAVGDSTMVVASATNIAVGDTMAIQDAQETGNTWSDTNEAFVVTGVSGTTITGYVIDPGPGDVGGFRYAHAAGTTTKDNYSAYPLILMGPNSITKAASDFTGAYGETVITGPFDRLGRFLTFGWYAIVGYSRTRNQWLWRYETSSSMG